MSKRLALFSAMVFGVSLILSACTATQQGALIGSGVGAGAGLALGRNTTGALIGAAGGAALGALTGEVVERRSQDQAQERRISELELQQSRQQRGEAAVGSPMGYDPTAGEILNDTRWKVNVYIDESSSSSRRGSPTMVLMPRETKSFSMDVGQHRVVAEAFVSTQYGNRFVGQYDQVINIDPKSSGWRVRFGENSFN